MAARDDEDDDADADVEDSDSSDLSKGKGKAKAKPSNRRRSMDPFLDDEGADSSELEVFGVSKGKNR
jgi:hypothetical protein